jgi:hypothetical protein
LSRGGSFDCRPRSQSGPIGVSVVEPCLRHTQPSHVFDVTVSGYGGGKPCYAGLDESVMLVPYKENVCPDHHTILFSCLVFVQQTINVVRQLILIGHSSFVYLG